MSWWKSTLCIVALVAGTFAGVGIALRQDKGREPVTITDDPWQDVLERYKLTTDQALLDWLHRHSEDDNDLDVDRLIRQLGSEQFDVREKAQEKLLRLRLVGLDALRKARKSEDRETARRATELVEAIEKETRVALPLIIVRTLLRMRPPGTVETLMRYLPFAADEEIEEEIYFGIERLTRESKQERKVLAKGLADRQPERRALAACLLGRSEEKAIRNQVRSLLSDAAPTVRMRAAQGLLAAGDFEAVPALIQILADNPVALAWQAEELLHWVAGEASPRECVGAATPDRVKECQAQWTKWWKENQGKLDFKALLREQRRPGLLIVCEQSSEKKVGFVSCYGCTGRANWKIESKEPMHALLLKSGKILVLDRAEKLAKEIDLGGKQFWTRDGAWVRCRELANREIQLIGRPSFVHCAVDGKPVALLDRDIVVDGSVFDGEIAGSLGNGKLLCVTHSRRLIAEFDAGNGELSNERRTDGAIDGGFIIAQVCPDRRLLGIQGDLLLEVDHHGKRKWECPVRGCSSAALLPTGNLAAVVRWPTSRVVEVDRRGTTVWQTLGDETPRQVSPCLSLIRVGFPTLEPPASSFESSEYYGTLALKEIGVKPRVLQAIKELGFDAGCASLVLDCLAEEEAMLRKAAEELLQNRTPSSLTILHQGAKDRRSVVRMRTAEIMSEIRVKDQKSQELLRQLLTDAEPQVVKQSLIAIRLTNGVNQECVPLLAQIAKQHKDRLNDKDSSELVSHAIVCLGLSQDKAAAEKVLRGFTASPCREWRHETTLALKNLGIVSKEMISGLIKEVEDNDDKAKREALRVLRLLGNEAKECIPTLMREFVRIEKLGSKESEVTCHAILWTVGAAGKEDESVAKFLSDAILNQRLASSIRTEAIESIEFIGRPARQALPALRQVARENDASLKRAAERMIRRLEGK
jgi:hypothetical protein